MSRYGFSCCSCGSSMLKPTESPPPSRQPRFAASITPGPPPVTTAQPASAKSRAVSRASSYDLDSSGARAEPKQETAGRSIRWTASKPAKNSLPIESVCRRSSSSPWWVWKRSRSRIRLEHPTVPGREQAADERGREQDVHRSHEHRALPLGGVRLDGHAVLEPDPRPVPRIGDRA